MLCGTPTVRPCIQEVPVALTVMAGLVPAIPRLASLHKRQRNTWMPATERGHDEA